MFPTFEPALRKHAAAYMVVTQHEPKSSIKRLSAEKKHSDLLF
jgi:hypothetical protein